MPGFFILFIKQELNICILLEMFLVMTILKTFFSSTPAIFVCLNVIY